MSADAVQLTELAAEIAREAGVLARLRRAEGVTVAATKTSLADLVTAADREVEELVRARLAAARPDDGFLGEESGGAGGTSGVTWVVDPIDGTVNYAKGIPQYAVSIAAVSGKPAPATWTPLAGAVFSPVVGELFTATAGEGAWLDGQRIRVAEADAAGALIATGFGYDPATHAGDLAAVSRIMPLARDLRRMGAASLDLANVAAGRLDAYFERGLHPWDVAAGSLLVTEAGGRFAFIADDDRRPMTVAGAPWVFDDLLDRLG